MIKQTKAFVYKSKPAHFPPPDTPTFAYATQRYVLKSSAKQCNQRINKKGGNVPHSGVVIKRIVQVQGGISCAAAVLCHGRVLADKTEGLNALQRTNEHVRLSAITVCI